MNDKKDTVFYGVKVGEHSFVPDDLIKEIQERVIDKGYNLTYVRPHVMPDNPEVYFVKWAKFLSENKVYFYFGYNTGQMPKPGKPSFIIDEQMTAKMKEVAGEYFLGVAISEAGGSYACKAEGYFTK